MANADVASRTTDDIYQSIRTMVLNCELLPNQRINQNTLAQTLGVSRTPVIKALHMLEAEGLVDNIPNRGFYIHKTTLRELIELFMLRQSLEMVAANNLVEVGTGEQIDQLYALFAPFIDQESINTNAYFSADRRFHSLMMEWCDNSLLRHINESLRLMDRTFSFGLLRPPKETLNEHLAIIDALRSRDAVRVQEVVRQHTECTKQNLQNISRQIRVLGIDTSKLSINDIIQGQDAATGT
jgi:DNA-binding GntR family transcriptional regulator